MREFTPSTTIEVLGKNPGEGNPLISHKFGADGNAFVHDGRVYVYMTNDTQVYNPGPDGTSPTNTYGGINTITVISSDDLVNWTDHGEIPVAGPNGLAKYATQSWAPAVESRVVDGKEQFFLYFANNGAATGVVVGDSPLGPWRDERGSLLITSQTPGASDGRNWLFDPGVFIDDDGQGYLYFGGGGNDGSNSYENTNHPKSTRVVKLGADMISTDGAAETIDAPLMFEAGHVFKRDGKYYYSYSSNFGFGGPIDPNGPPTGAIAYLVADNPMGPWTPDKYAGVIFKNPGNYFGAGGNNHQSVFELNGEHYFTYHAQTLNRRITGGATQGFRSPHIAKLEFNADGTIKEVVGTFDGVEQIRHLDPYRVVEAETIAWQQGLATKRLNAPNDVPQLALHDVDNGDWTSLSSADFGSGTTGVSARVKPLTAGTSVQLRLDDRTGPVVATIPVDGPVGEWTEVGTELDGVAGVHDVYFTFVGPEGRDLLEVDSWQFAKPSLKVEGDADTRCAGPNVKLTVRVTNNESAPVDFVVETPYGTKSFDDVEPGKTRFHPFTTRQSAVAAGTAEVTAKAVVDGHEVSTALSVPYDARTCR
ncbi:hypothetical protein ADK67_20955 [Saccharothrix sp. NRRL B-16348]|nr:hypothetical protein ADK67_20955 [Saccharothrix sp. NRRL B-16348]